MEPDDDDVLTIIIFPEILSVITKHAVTKLPSRWEKTNKYEIVRTSVPVRK